MPCLARLIACTLLLAPLSWLLPACTSAPYKYVPASTPAAEIGATRGAIYPIQPAPEGSLQVISAGVVELRRPLDGSATRAMHIRMIADNRSRGDEWTIDACKQLLVLPRAPERAPIQVIATGERPSLPRVEILPGQSRVIDFFFALPPALRKSSSIPTFALQWQLDTRHGTIARTTAFERYAYLSPPPPAPAGAPPYINGTGIGWGPAWGYANSYSRWTFPAP